jgi:hypothetical protein
VLSLKPNFSNPREPVVGDRARKVGRRRPKFLATVHPRASNACAIPKVVQIEVVLCRVRRMASPEAKWTCGIDVEPFSVRKLTRENYIVAANSAVVVRLTLRLAYLPLTDLSITAKKLPSDWSEVPILTRCCFRRITGCIAAT